MPDQLNIPDTDGKPDFTEGKTYEDVLEMASGAKYESLEELRQARSKVSFWDKLKLTWQGKTQVGRIAGTVLDVAETFAPNWAAEVRDLIQTKPTIMKTKKKTQSKTWWGIITVVLAALLGAFGIAANPDFLADGFQLTEDLKMAIAFVGAVIGWALERWGQRTAKTEIR